MSRSYPIWFDVDAPDYARPKSYGTRDNSATDVRVGTSAGNSQLLARHTTRVVRSPETGNTYFIHDVYCDGVRIATLRKTMYDGGSWGETELIWDSSVGQKETSEDTIL